MTVIGHFDGGHSTGCRPISSVWGPRACMRLLRCLTVVVGSLLVLLGLTAEPVGAHAITESLVSTGQSIAITSVEPRTVIPVLNVSANETVSGSSISERSQAFQVWKEAVGA